MCLAGVWLNSSRGRGGGGGGGGGGPVAPLAPPLATTLHSPKFSIKERLYIIWCAYFANGDFTQKAKFDSMHGKLRNGPDKNASNNGNEHVGMQKRC